MFKEGVGVFEQHLQKADGGNESGNSRGACGACSQPALHTIMSCIFNPLNDPFHR